MKIFLAVLVLLNRGCTGFLIHGTLTPYERPRILYYSLAQVSRNGEDYAPFLASRWQEYDYQKGLGTAKSSSRIEGGEWVDNDLAIPVDWQNDQDKLASSTNSSVVRVQQQHPEAEESQRSTYEKTRYIPSRSYWRVFVSTDDNGYTFDVVTVVVKGGLRSEFSSIKMYNELKEFHDNLVKHFGHKDIPALPPPEEDQINNFFQALFSGSMSVDDEYVRMPLILSCPNFYDFVGAPPELWELPSQVLEGEVVLDTCNRHMKDDGWRGPTSSREHSRRWRGQFEWSESKDSSLLYSEIGMAIFGGLIGGPIGAAAGAVADTTHLYAPQQGHHLAKQSSIAGNVARSLGRVTEEIVEIGKEIDEDIGISKRLKDILTRVKENIDSM